MPWDCTMHGSSCHPGLAQGEAWDLYPLHQHSKASGVTQQAANASAYVNIKLQACLVPSVPGNSCMGGTGANPLTAAACAMCCRLQPLMMLYRVPPKWQRGLGNKLMQRCVLGGAHDGLFIKRVIGRALDTIETSVGPGDQSYYSSPGRIPEPSIRSLLCTSHHGRPSHGHRCLEVEQQALI